MPHFIISCTDKPDALELRKATRAAHLAYLSETGLTRVGGPVLDESGAPKGSHLLIEAADLKAAQDFADNDPYTKAGLFQSVTIAPFNWVIGAPD